jgi:hypothetical protein
MSAGAQSPKRKSHDRNYLDERPSRFLVTDRVELSLGQDQCFLILVVLPVQDDKLLLP